MLIGAIDPGYGTGYALYHTERGAFTSWETVRGRMDLEDMTGCDVIVCEQYVVTSKGGQETDALRHIGTIETFCETRGIRLVMQKPADAVKFSKDNKLSALGWFFPTKDDHQNMAARHLLRFLFKEKLLRAEDKSRLAAIIR